MSKFKSIAESILGILILLLLVSIIVIAIIFFKTTLLIVLLGCFLFFMPWCGDNYIISCGFFFKKK